MSTSNRLSISPLPLRYRSEKGRGEQREEEVGGRAAQGSNHNLHFTNMRFLDAPLVKRERIGKRLPMSPLSWRHRSEKGTGELGNEEVGCTAVQGPNHILRSTDMYFLDAPLVKRERIGKRLPMSPLSWRHRSEKGTGELGNEEVGCTAVQGPNHILRSTDMYFLDAPLVKRERIGKSLDSLCAR